jgi:hypothetical protein
MSVKNILQPSDLIDKDDDNFDKPTKDIINAGYSVVTGAVAGAELGGPVGAVIGGVVAGAASLLKSNDENSN